MNVTAYTDVNGKRYTIEFRKGYGWFIMQGEQTLMGFQTLKLLNAYLKRVDERGGRLYTPTARETYGGK